MRQGAEHSFMWDLSSQHYWPVALTRARIRPWIVNPEAVDQIRKGASFLKEQARWLKAQKNPFGLDELNETFQRAFRAPLSLKDTLDEIGLITLPSTLSPIVSFDEHRKLHARADNYLLTERTLQPTGAHLASTRHAQTPYFQFKGIGRSDLVNRLDYHHAWGGFPARDALRGLVGDFVAGARSKNGSLKTIAIFLYEDSFLPGVPLALVLRENNGYRLTQISRDYLYDSDRAKIKTHLTSTLGTRSFTQASQAVITHYLESFKNGLAHASWFPENGLINGTFIDSESLDFTEDGSTFPASLTLAIRDARAEAKSAAKEPRLKDIVRPGARIYLIDSSYHRLRLQSAQSAKSLGVIYERGETEKPSLSPTDFFDRAVKKHLPELARWSALSTHASLAEHATTQRDRPLQSFTWSRELHSIFGDLPLIASEFDAKSKTLTITTGDDPVRVRKPALSRLQKLEIAFWPAASDWKTSFSNWRKLEAALGSLR